MWGRPGLRAGKTAAVFAGLGTSERALPTIIPGVTAIVILAGEVSTGRSGAKVAPRCCGSSQTLLVTTGLQSVAPELILASLIIPPVRSALVIPGLIWTVEIPAAGR